MQKIILTAFLFAFFHSVMQAEDTTNPNLDLIKIVDQNDVPIDGRIFCVGQLMNLHLRPTPANATVTNVQWTIPDTKIRNWQSGVLTPFNPANLTQQPILYYWLDGNVQKTVSASAKVNGKDASTQSTVTLEMPKVSSYTSKTGTVSPYPVSGGLVLGGAASNLGIEWTGNITAPAHFPGTYRLTQLVHVVRQIQLNSSGWKHSDTSGLDTSEAYGGMTLPKAAGATFVIKSNDNPGNHPSQPDVIHLDIQAGYNGKKESFNTYIMFKPDAQPDAIWVTVGLLDWGWLAAVHRPSTVDQWEPPTGGAVPPDPKGAQSISLPLWTNVVNSGNITNSPGLPTP